MNDFEQEIKADFLTEAKELLSNTEQCFLNLEKNSEDDGNINNLFRLAHNLKGSSGAVGFSDLAEFTHHLESLLLELKEKKIKVSEPIVNLLLRCNDYLAVTIQLLESDMGADYKNPSLSAELVNALHSSTVTAFDEAAEKPPPTISAPHMHSDAPSTSGKEESIRVSLSRIDQLLNNVGELVIFQTVMNQQVRSPGVKVPPIVLRSLNDMSKILKETQEVAMGLRMLPAKQTFRKMLRIVRDTSKAIGKDVELHLSGEETEIDKTVLEQIGDPLVHIIRNAVDHGLEDGGERIQKGKNPIGQVHLSAFHQAGHIIIEVKDDGKGLNPQYLTQKAKDKGLLEETVQLSDEEAFDLIFLPGFSTKEKVTDVSGRGVGMDVVKTNIAQIQGEIGIESKIDHGTTFRISLPLTLAIIDSIIVQVAQERYIIPLSQVSEFFRPKQQEINFAYERAELLTLRQETMPVHRMDSVIHETPAVARPASEMTALIARNNNQNPFAILVDEIISQQQVVIKPLGQELKGRAGLMGSAILGDGRPALILDIYELIKKQKNSTRRRTEAA